MTCKDDNEVEIDYKQCFVVSQQILFVLIILSMGFQLVYGFFMIVGMYYGVNGYSSRYFIINTQNQLRNLTTIKIIN